MEKTNVMRVLDQKKVPYRAYCYLKEDEEPLTNGADVAKALGQSPQRVFKTLVTVGHSGEYYVFVIPAASELDLKKAAVSVGEKSITMIKSKELLPLTGYIHGGCSPIGMKKLFATVVDETAILYDTIFVSAGKIGSQIELSLSGLEQMVPLKTADLI